MLVHLVDANGHYKYTGDEANPKVATLEAQGFTHADTAPPDKTSKWDGNAWVSDPSLVDAVALVDWEDARRSSYPTIGDQLDMIYWDQVNGTTTFKDHVAAVKADNPKLEE